jgi:hypothetical protein
MVIDMPRLPGVLGARELSQARIYGLEGGPAMRIAWT